MSHHVPLHLDLLGALLEKAPRQLIALGTLESKLLKYDIKEHPVHKPVFIGGLARGGSTLLLEIMNSRNEFCSFQYKDYPFLHFLYFWNKIRMFVPDNPQKVERGHKDRMMINAQSPEAMDEILWMAFFQGLHDPVMKNIFDRQTSNASFETFYKRILSKLLFLRRSSRVVLKNNYYSTRMPYIKKMFPDARFLIPVRQPEEHIFSLIKQHKLISDEQARSPRSFRYMKRHGHYEFGQDMRPVNFGETDAVLSIQASMRKGDFIDAYARMWSETYRYIYETLEHMPRLKEQCLIVNYDHLCAEPSQELKKILSFCSAKDPQDIVDQWSDKISKPSYYNIDFKDEERERIQDLTSETWSLYN